MNVGCSIVTVTVFPCASTDTEVRTGGGVGVIAGGATGVKIVGGAVGIGESVVEDGGGVTPLDSCTELLPDPKLVMYGEPLVLVRTGPPVPPPAPELDDPLNGDATDVVGLTAVISVVVMYVFVMYVVGALLILIV